MALLKKLFQQDFKKEVNNDYGCSKGYTGHRYLGILFKFVVKFFKYFINGG